MKFTEYIENKLWPWQIKWMKDSSTWKIALKARQIGYSEVCVLVAILHCLKFPNHNYFLVSTRTKSAQRQLLDRARNRFIPTMMKTDMKQLLQGTSINKKEIVFPNNSRLIACSNEAERLRGEDKASFLFDEAATYAKRILQSLKKSVFPIVRAGTNPHGKIQLISTPKPEENLFKKIWEDELSYPDWSRHQTDIKAACQSKEYYESDWKKFRNQCASEDEWKQEYMCQFLKSSGGYFDFDKITELDQEPGWSQQENYIGIDIGGQNDYTALAVLNKNGSQYHCSAVYRMRDVDYEKQTELIKQLIKKHDPFKGCIDQSMHRDLTERITKEFPQMKGQQANRKHNVEYTQRLRDLIDHENIFFNLNNLYTYHEDGFVEDRSKYLARDLGKVQKKQTPSGKVKFDAPRDDSGHADSYSALVHAVMAAEKGTGKFLGFF